MKTSHTEIYTSNLSTHFFNIMNYFISYFRILLLGFNATRSPFLDRGIPVWNGWDIIDLRFVCSVGQSWQVTWEQPHSL